MNRCDYATCTRPGPHHADGWHFCSYHYGEHQQEFGTPAQQAANGRAKANTSERMQQAEQIVADALTAGGWTRNEFLGRYRGNPALVEARTAAMWRIRTDTGLSYPQIGALFGGRNHATVISVVRHRQQQEVA